MVFVELNIEMSKRSTKVSSFFKSSFSIIKKKKRARSRDIQLILTYQWRNLIILE